MRDGPSINQRNGTLFEDPKEKKQKKYCIKKDENLVFVNFFDEHEVSRRDIQGVVSEVNESELDKFFIEPQEVCCDEVNELELDKFFVEPQEVCCDEEERLSLDQFFAEPEDSQVNGQAKFRRFGIGRVLFWAAAPMLFLDKFFDKPQFDALIEENKKEEQEKNTVEQEVMEQCAAFEALRIINGKCLFSRPCPELSKIA